MTKVWIALDENGKFLGIAPSRRFAVERYIPDTDEFDFVDEIHASGKTYTYKYVYRNGCSVEQWLTL